MAEEDFSKQTIETVAKRSANFCSNPDCSVLTCGPADEDNRALNLGEAAHIFGARPGSARFREEMAPKERGDITNAIWLCRNCHKLADSDPQQFSADSLFIWRREHEARIAQQLGKRGEIIRQQLLSQKLAQFQSSSYLAQQIVIDKPPYWEYKLTIELLRAGLTPIMEKWRALKDGLYTKPVESILRPSIVDWNRARTREAGDVTSVISNVVNNEIPASWGPAGVPGNELAILNACNLLIDVCARALDWEEKVRFALLPSEFSEFQSNLIGVLGRQLEEIRRLPSELAKPFESEPPLRDHHVHLFFDLPDGWLEKTLKSFEDGLNQ